jgi:hypothetical protein
MSFTPAKFNAGLNEAETSIVTRYASFLICLLTSPASDLMLSPGIFERFSRTILSLTEFGNIRTMSLVTISVSVRTRISSSHCPKMSQLWPSGSCRDLRATLSGPQALEPLPEVQVGCVLVLSIVHIRVDLLWAVCQGSVAGIP